MAIIGGGLLTIVVIVVLVLVNLPVQSVEVVPAGDGAPAPVSTPMPVQAPPTTIRQVTPEPLPTIFSTPQNNSVINLESPK